MKILKIQALRGPNIWSIRRQKLIQMRLDLEELEERPTDKIEGFKERLENFFPHLSNTVVQRGVEVDFFKGLTEVLGWDMSLNISL